MVNVLFERALDIVAVRLLITKLVAAWAKKQISSINNVRVFCNSVLVLGCISTHK